MTTLNTLSQLSSSILVYIQTFSKDFYPVLANFMKCIDSAMVIGIRKNLLIIHWIVCPPKMKIWCN